LKYDSQAKPLLEFLSNSCGVNFSFRQVATPSDFKYYISHLKQASYKDFSIVYLCFHGEKGIIAFAGSDNKAKCSICSLIDFANENEGIFRGKFVHFGSCRTFKMNDSEIKQFKRLTGAIVVSGYERSVEMTTSFIFEAWLLNTLYRYPNLRATSLMNRAQKEMPYFVDKFKFMAL
jgi:hypothetical protein